MNRSTNSYKFSTIECSLFRVVSLVPFIQSALRFSLLSGLFVLVFSLTSVGHTGTLNKMDFNKDTNKESASGEIGGDAGGNIGGDFILTDHNGQPFKLSDQRGKLVLVFFGYTYCPDICPTELSYISRVLHSLDKKADKVIPLFISIDPMRDTPEKLKQYVPFYSPQLIGLTGTQDMVDKVADAYHVQRRIHEHQATDNNYLVDHSANLYVVNGEGKLVSIIPFGLPVEHIQQVIETELSKMDE